MFDKIFPKFIATTFLGMLLCYIGYIIYFFLGRGYFPGYEDESIYYNSARLFFETGSVKGESCINEQFSTLLSANWYGIFYNLFYGGIARLIGFHSSFFIWLNFFLVFISMGFIARISMSRVQIITALLCFLSLDMVFNYSFTYYPELLNIFFGIVLCFLLIKIFEKQDEKEGMKYIFLFAFFVLLFSLFRVTWAFWIIGILPFAKNKKQLMFFLLLLLVLIGSAILYEQFFCAPPLVGGGLILGYLRNFQLISFFKELFINFARNGYYFFVLNWKAEWSWIFIKLLLLVFASHQIYSLMKNRNRLIQSAALIFLFNMLFLFFMYFAIYPYIMKITASLFILYALVVIYLDIKMLRNILVFCVLISIPAVFQNTYRTINERTSVFDAKETVYKSSLEEVRQIADWVNPNKENIVMLLDYEFRQLLPESVFAASLPLSTKTKFPIRYTYSLFKSDIAYESNFDSFHRIHVDYILSAHELHRTDVMLLHQAHFFYFYKII